MLQIQIMVFNSGYLVYFQDKRKPFLYMYYVLPSGCKSLNELHNSCDVNKDKVFVDEPEVSAVRSIKDLRRFPAIANFIGDLYVGLWISPSLLL